MSRKKESLRRRWRHGWLDEPHCVESVWPDWAMWESYWVEILLQKRPKYLTTLWTTTKTWLSKYKLLWLIFGQLMEKLGNLLFQYLVTLCGVHKNDRPERERERESKTKRSTIDVKNGKCVSRERAEMAWDGLAKIQQFPVPKLKAVTKNITLCWQKLWRTVAMEESHVQEVLSSIPSTGHLNGLYLFTHIGCKIVPTYCLKRRRNNQKSLE